MTAGLRFRLRKLGPALWDLSPCPILAYYSWQAIEILKSGGWFSELGCFSMLLAVPPAAAIWLQIRMAPRMARLARRARREELAVTPLPARAYLWPRLRGPFLLLLAPPWTAWFVLEFRLLQWVGLPSEWNDKKWIAPLALLSVGALATAISIRGALRLLARLCLAGERTAAVVLLPMGWSALAVAIPYGGGALTLKVLDLAAAGHTPWADLFLLSGLAFATIYGSIRLLAGKANPWRAACAAYYTFD